SGTTCLRGYSMGGRGGLYLRPRPQPRKDHHGGHLSRAIWQTLQGNGQGNGRYLRPRKNPSRLGSRQDGRVLPVEPSYCPGNRAGHAIPQQSRGRPRAQQIGRRRPVSRSLGAFRRHPWDRESRSSASRRLAQIIRLGNTLRRRRNNFRGRTPGRTQGNPRQDYQQPQGDCL
ncbi:uncharacterized protein METZ01_LOCUS442866, partial [marine metagenome]